uniref:DS cell adhesion molecule like 1 n=1 Tax=Equus asinus TaxID=9793 RepID=A0A9L0I6M1_EQUAS
MWLVTFLLLLDSLHKALSTTMTTSAPRRMRPARSGALTSASKQFSGNPTPSGWRIKGQCVETWPSSSASSPLQCRNMLALCPGRRTRSPSSQTHKKKNFMTLGREHHGPALIQFLDCGPDAVRDVISSLKNRLSFLFPSGLWPVMNEKILGLTNSYMTE